MSALQRWRDSPVDALLTVALALLVGAILTVFASHAAGAALGSTDHGSGKGTTLANYNYDSARQPVRRSAGWAVASGRFTSGIASGERVAGWTVAAVEESSSFTGDAGAAGDSAGDPATSCLNSFTADAPVLMANGKEDLIADVKVGDKATATGKTIARRSNGCRHDAWEASRAAAVTVIDRVVEVDKPITVIEQVAVPALPEGAAWASVLHELARHVKAGKLQQLTDVGCTWDGYALVPPGAG